jgi:hypothetical protein
MRRPVLTLKKPGFQTGTVPQPAKKPITPPNFGHPQNPKQFHQLGTPKNGRY